MERCIGSPPDAPFPVPPQQIKNQHRLAGPFVPSMRLRVHGAATFLTRVWQSVSREVRRESACLSSDSELRGD